MTRDPRRPRTAAQVAGDESERRLRHDDLRGTASWQRTHRSKPLASNTHVGGGGYFDRVPASLSTDKGAGFNLKYLKVPPQKEVTPDFLGPEN